MAEKRTGSGRPADCLHYSGRWSPQVFPKSDRNHHAPPLTVTPDLIGGRLPGGAAAADRTAPHHPHKLHPGSSPG